MIYVTPTALISQCFLSCAVPCENLHRGYHYSSFKCFIVKFWKSYSLVSIPQNRDWETVIHRTKFRMLPFVFFKSFIEVYFIYYKVHHFKSTVYWVLIFFRLYNCYHSLTLEQFYILPKKTPYPHTLLILYIPLPTPARGNPLISFLSLWFHLPWTLQINGIIQHMAFCDSRLSLNLMFSRFML